MHYGPADFPLTEDWLIGKKFHSHKQLKHPPQECELIPQEKKLIKELMTIQHCVTLAQNR